MDRQVTRRTLVAAAALACPAAGRAWGRMDAISGAPRPWGATPSARQLAWHGREMYAFVHFTINTFLDKEWGYGDEDPALFDPTGFDADQIVAAAKAGNLDALILTAKHHDGFCLWPSPLTERSIRNSPYKNGKGDIVRELSDACRRAGLSFGVYLSPWDRSHKDYGHPAYVDYFRAQLTDLCTHYGPFCEIWFDGANGGDGWYGGAKEMRKIDASRYYDWPSTIALVRKLQPMACIFGPIGADLRSVGNEDGVAGDPCWPTMPDAPYRDDNGNSGVRGGALWWPAETDVSIRPGWFYHEDEDGQVKTPAQLSSIFDTSVGRGSNLLLNLPPDRRGVIAEPDVASLTAFGAAIRASFATNLAQGAVARATAERGPRFAPANVLDGDPDSYWSTPDAETTPALTLDLPPGQPFDLIRLREYLPLGARVTRFALDVADSDEAGWREIANHDCIGPRRIIRLPSPIRPRRLRLRIVEAPACPAIAEVALFRWVKPQGVAPSPSRNVMLLDRSGWRIAAASSPGAQALLDGDIFTTWRTPVPGQVTIDLGRVEPVTGFTMTPSRDFTDKTSGPPSAYALEASANGRDWEAVIRGEFPNIVHMRQTQRVHLAAPIPARWLRFSFPAVAFAAPQIAITEIGVFGALR